ncbi:Conserved oligomeric Golgi complex subunit 3 [Wickerhamiella sorbophila]|uniref:Conserved oligomeric Golgi complex subunit 3 n=1 Tax=Wickerhamiella sorbophila TaxID=45607 RepID=A0A2T0FBW8_9ASCO|nr:Conserved oligomeric Golgi complex subunit 3 [Wickerhamiella sorbophila]PRT52455.1 Conserved oligomeric Golgi complex subunit 3 [Wickerhamiella sorbophila]
MFDDWAYREHFDTPRRERAKSIVQSVASQISAEEDWVLPVVELRRRANSLPRSEKVTTRSWPLDTPFLDAQKAEMNDWKLWVGPEYSIDDFDEALFSAQILESQTVLERARLAISVYNRLGAESEQLIDNIEATKSNLENINTQIVEMRVVSDGGIHEQEKLDQLHKDLDKYLRIYDNLDNSTRILNKPGNKLVSKVQEFRTLLQNLDEGLEFCKQHPEFKDMDLYEMRHTQCILRAVTLAQEFCVGHLRKVTGSILQKLVASSTSSTTGAMHALIWTKFEADAEFISPIVSVIKSRDDEKLESLLMEVQKQYFTCRSQLISPEISRSLAPLAPPGPPDFIVGAQNILVQFMTLFNKELDAYRKVMGEPDEQYEQWLTDLCQPLYDQLRRYIIRETDISQLCQLIMSIQGHDTQAFDPIYRDTQNRLVFRADLIVDGISKYQPTPKDWGKTVYPTVTQALDLLGQVYELLNNEVFNNLAYRCVNQCILSLETGRESAMTRLGKIEGSLFHIQQLVLLQTRIMDFNVEHSVEHDVDFSGLQTFVEAFWQNRSRFTSVRELFGIARTSMPHVIEHMIDAMEGLYSALRLAVTRFTEYATDSMIDPISKNDARTAQHDVHNFREAVAVELKRINTVVHDYISEPRVCDVLLDSLQDDLVKKYTEYYHLIYNTGSPDMLDGVMDADAMMAWLGELTRQFQTNL